MRQSWKFLIRANFVLASLLLAACQDGLQEGLQEDTGGPVVVGMTAGGARTRTEMQANGLSAEWTSGDELAVWARNASGDFVLSNQIFKTYGIDSSRGFFTSTLSEAMPEDTYTYMCCYPAPLSVDGTKVTFNIPSVQDGKVSGGSDVMIASPVQHGALGPVPDPEDHSGMSMTMNRMMHQFRFYISEDDAVLGDEKLVRLLLDFTKGVVGTVTLDTADPTLAPVLENSSGSLVLELAEPLGVSDDSNPEYACVAVFPIAFDSGDVLGLKAYTDDKIVLFNPVNLSDKTCLAGHSTPVRLKVKQVIDYPYVLNFTVSGNNLGEDPLSITLEAPEGCVWPSSGSNVYTYSPGREIPVGETVSFKFEDKEQYQAFSGASVNVTFDSEHAITYAKTKVNDISIEGDTDEEMFSAALPYLFYEDFSSLDVYDGDYKDGVNTSVEQASLPGRDLSAYGLPAGWSGARTGCDAAGTAILVGSRVDYVIAGGTRSYGRLESPALSALKKASDIKVTFDYGGSRSGSSNFYPVGVCGYVYGEGLLSGYATQFVNDPSWTDISGVTSIPNIPKSGNATTLTTMSYTISGCDGYCRLSWHVGGMGTAFIANGLQWMYVDNIKVQIVNN